MDEQTKKLIITLTEKTILAKISWEKTSRDAEFICVVPGGSVTVDSYWEFEDDTGDEVLVQDMGILNSLGEEIDRVRYTPNWGVEYKLLQSLYNAAHRRHFKIDEVITSIIDSISSL